MSTSRTFTILKPDCLEKNNQGKVIDHILAKGFSILAMKQIRITREAAEGFYDIHRERPFFGELVEFMTRGKVIVAALEKNGSDAVSFFREVIGATNPAEAAEGTIRKLYADSIGENCVHGSDSDENAAREISFFFSETELI
ncbi:MAG: nucleoside-diphosphate kinase [Calditrichaeota bacterium]|nr:nucleoside-diphosphate kinase [Calditrichota bacterium]